MDSHTEITNLKGKLREANDICEQQRKQHMQSIRELQDKLQKTVIGRESILNMKYV